MLLFGSRSLSDRGIGVPGASSGLRLQFAGPPVLKSAALKLRSISGLCTIWYEVKARCNTRQGHGSAIAKQKPRTSRSEVRPTRWLLPPVVLSFSRVPCRRNGSSETGSFLPYRR